LYLSVIIPHNGCGDQIMVTARSVFEALQGRDLTYERLRQALQQFCSDNLEKLPPGFSTRELFAVASRNGWIQQDANGAIRISLDNRRQAHVPGARKRRAMAIR
jgi:hypothetical protein